MLMSNNSMDMQLMFYLIHNELNGPVRVGKQSEISRLYPQSNLKAGMQAMCGTGSSVDYMQHISYKRERVAYYSTK